MTRKTQHYSKEFRAEAVKTVLEQGGRSAKGHRFYPSPKVRWDNGFPQPEKVWLHHQNRALLPSWSLRFFTCVTC